MAGKVLVEDAGTGLANQSDRDWLDGGHLMAVGHTGVSGLLVGGAFTPDFGVPDVDVAQCMARIVASSVGSRDHGSGVTTWDEVVITVQVEAATLSLTDTDTNEIYIDVSLSSGPDDVSYTAVDSQGSAPSAPFLKIGEVDTDADTTSEQWNLLRPGVLSFPTETAATSEDTAGRLAEGTNVYDRTNDTQFVVTA